MNLQVVRVTEKQSSSLYSFLMSKVWAEGAEGLKNVQGARVEGFRV